MGEVVDVPQRSQKERRGRNRRFLCDLPTRSFLFAPCQIPYLVYASRDYEIMESAKRCVHSCTLLIKQLTALCAVVLGPRVQFGTGGSQQIDFF